MLKSGGRIAIFDKFLPERERLTARRRLLGALISRLGTDPNRRLAPILQGFSDLVVERREPDLLSGQYELVWLRKW